jgi:predicted ATPase/DNA-binding winged helix-turn-helix (wHTH) protein
MDHALEYRFGNAQVRPQQRQLLVCGQPRQVGARAFDLLLTLIERRERVVRKNELLDCVWPGMVVEENNLQVQISSLRKLLGPQAISTIPGRGYRFTAMLDVAGAHAAVSLDGAVVQPQRAAGNLPAMNSVLYGRDRELQQLRSIAGVHRIVTLVGAGGIGKTALAQALAHDLMPGCPDGAWWCELASIADASLVPGSVADVLRVQLRNGGAHEVALGVASRELLLVLDNCEHLPHAASELVWALYRCAPGVRVLATSREPLKLVDEHVFRLQGLEVPNGDEPAARDTGALALFEARVRAADASFELAPCDLEAAIETCRHLDGTPLAIEFAAARVPLFGVRGLRDRLDDRFRVLTRGSRFAQPRHQTLYAALEWSFALLDDEQQRMFRRLAVFVGGFALPCAQRVASDAGMDRWKAVEELGNLVDKSLVAVEPSEFPRYRLLETTRAFAQGKLADAGEVEAARRSHACAMLESFEATCADELSVPLSRRLAQHRSDLDNLRAALDWCFGPNGDRVLGVALSAASAWFWRELGTGRPEGMRRLRLAFDNVDARTAPLVEARLCIEWTALATPQVSDTEHARAQRAVDLCRAMHDEKRLAIALGALGRTCAHRGEHDAAKGTLMEQRALVQPGWPTFLRARVLTFQNFICFQGGDYEAALAVNRQVYVLAAELDDPLQMSSALANQEQCAAALGRWDECVQRGKELVELIEHHSDLHSALGAIVHGNLGIALQGVGAIDEALAEARIARPLFERMGDLLCLLDSLGSLAFARGFAADAARIAGCSDAGQAASGCRRERVEADLHARLMQRLAARFPPAQLRQLLEEGAALSVEAAASLALRDEPATPQAWPGSSGPAAPPVARGMHRARA